MSKFDITEAMERADLAQRFSQFRLITGMKPGVDILVFRSDDLLDTVLMSVRRRGSETVWVAVGSHEDKEFSIVSFSSVQPNGDGEDHALRFSPASTVGDLLNLFSPGSEITIKSMSDELIFQLPEETEDSSDSCEHRELV